MTPVKTKKLRSSLARQTIALIILGAVLLALVASLLVVNYVTSFRRFEDGGEVYYVRKQTDKEGKTSYILVDKQKNALDTTSDGYFITKTGNLVAINAKTGLPSLYARVETEGNEAVGINDRILIFPHTEKKNIQSLEVHNSNGTFSFYRMRIYEDVDKVTYMCMLHEGEYRLVAGDGTEYTRGADDLFTLKSGTKLAVDKNTGALHTAVYTDFDGANYYPRKNQDGEYRLYDAQGREVTETVEKTGTLTDKDGKPYEGTIYRYLVSAHGTLMQLDPTYGTLSVWSVQEYDAAHKSYYTFYFLYRNGDYVLCGADGKPITYTAIDDEHYYRTTNNAYIAFNTDNGRYNVRVRKDYYLIPDVKGTYTFYHKGTPCATNGAGYVPMPDGTYIFFDSASGSFSTLSFTGTEYKETESKYLNATVNAKAQGDFVIAGNETVEYDPSLFAALMVSGGYTITAAGGKLAQPLRLSDGTVDFSAYGLCEANRTDATGKEYHYTPAYYILKDLSGNVHKITIGDKIVSGAGYYVKYSKSEADGSFTDRQAVYILLDNLNTGFTQSYATFEYHSISDTLLAPVERLVTPMAVYPTTTNDYFNVKDFTLMVYNEKKSRDNLLDDDPGNDSDYYDILVRFSYSDIEERRNTVYSSQPYIMSTCELLGYTLNSFSADTVLGALRDLKPTAVRKIGVSDADMAKFGLDVAQYVLYYKMASTGLDQILMISKQTPNNTYYVYSEHYDMIVEVEATALQFLSWKRTDWVASDLYDTSIGFCKDITVESGKYKAQFDIFMSHTLTTKIRTSGSSNFTQIVTCDSSRTNRSLNITANINANLSSQSSGSASLITVSFDTLKHYYNSVTGHGETLSEADQKALEAFRKTIYQHEENKDGSALSLHALSLSYQGGVVEVGVYFYYYSNGEIVAVAKVNDETPCQVFSLNAYMNYEKIMYADALSEAERQEAFNFYLSSKISANAQFDFEKILAKTSDGVSSVYTNNKIVRTEADGTVVTDYALGRNQKIFFDVGNGDLLGVGSTWVRFYDMDDPATANGGYQKITDLPYTFKASNVRLILPQSDGGNILVPDGSLGEGDYTVTVTDYLVTVKKADGTEVRYIRSTGTSSFSNFYSTLLWASYEGLCDIPKEQMEAFRNSDDSACQMKLTIHTRTGSTYVYRTYQYSERRSYITLNGDGDFFVLRSFIDKIVNSSRAVLRNEKIDATGKY